MKRRELCLSRRLGGTCSDLTTCARPWTCSLWPTSRDSLLRCGCPFSLRASNGAQRHLSPLTN